MSFQTVLDAQDAQLLSAFDPATTSADSITSGAGSSPKSLSKPIRQYLDVPTKSPYRPRPSIDSTYSELSELSIYSDELRHSRPLVGNDAAAARLPSTSPAPPRRGRRSTLSALWIRNKGVVLVLLSQAFGSLMNVATRILETDGAHGKAMHPFQVLFARQSLTSAFSLAYGYYTHIPHFPFGPRNVLPLLIARGVFGFFGVFGLYFALLYLPLAEATVLTFLAPILSCYVCALLIPGESFSRQQQMAAFLSLVGVVVIARPATLFNNSSSSGPTPPSETAPNTTTITMIRSHHTSPFSNPTRPTPHQHLLAVLVSMLGVVGGCGAMTAIRWIGTRAHPLISVNYFSVWCTLVSLLAVAAVPGVGFRLPANIVEWSLLAGLGGCGFFLQFLLTAGLAYGGRSEDSSTSSRRTRRRGRNGEEEGDGEEEGLGSGGRGRSTEKERDELLKQGSGTRATNMVYSQMLFALMFDKLIWGVTPSVSSWAGSGLIVVSAVWVAVARDKDQNNKENSGSMVVGGDGSGTSAVVFKERPKRDGGGTAEEEQGLMSSGGGDVLEEGESSGEVLEMEDLSPKHETERETERSAIA